MKQLFILLVSCGILSCSIDDQLKYGHDLRVISMESAEIPIGVIGDTVIFRVMASSNDGLKRMEVTQVTQGLELLPKKVEFLMVGEEDLTMDVNGNFNCSVSSVMLNYPVVLSPKLLGDTTWIEFTFTAKDGDQKSISIARRVSNFKKFPIGTMLYDMFPSSNGNMFYSSTTHTTFNYKQYKHNCKLIDIYEYFDSDVKKHYLMSPDFSRVKEIVDAVTNITTVAGGSYDLSEMNHTRFIKLENINLNKISENDLGKLDFSQSTDCISFILGDNIGFLTTAGRKGILQISSINASNISKVKSVIQAKIL